MVFVVDWWQMTLGGICVGNFLHNWFYPRKLFIMTEFLPCGTTTVGNA